MQPYLKGKYEKGCWFHFGCCFHELSFFRDWFVMTDRNRLSSSDTSLEAPLTRSSIIWLHPTSMYLWLFVNFITKSLLQIYHDFYVWQPLISRSKRNLNAEMPSNRIERTNLLKGVYLKINCSKNLVNIFHFLSELSILAATFRKYRFHCQFLINFIS